MKKKTDVIGGKAGIICAMIFILLGALLYRGNAFGSEENPYLDVAKLCSAQYTMVDQDCGARDKDGVVVGDNAVLVFAHFPDATAGNKYFLVVFHMNKTGNWERMERYAPANNAGEQIGDYNYVNWGLGSYFCR